MLRGPTPSVRLSALGWDHDRCLRPMRACASAWSRERGGVEVEWSARSLLAFGDQPLEEAAADFDLLVIDHPFCGVAAATGCLRPLDELLEPAVLAELEQGAVGPSHDAYAHAGHQWALATDAACQVTAVREDLRAGPVPTSLKGVLALARARPGRVAVPLAPAHAISAWLTLLAGAGTPFRTPGEGGRRAGVAALAVLDELYRLGPPDAVTWESPDVLDRLTRADDLLLVPLTYGYITYSTPGMVARPCRFTDVTSGGRGSVGAVLGGAGLAVSAASAHPEEAAAFAAWASGASAQRDVVAANGGQPGARAAWDDPALDAAARGFYTGTRRSMDDAWIRPRTTWWPDFQLRAGVLIADGLTAGAAPADLCDAVLDLTPDPTPL